MCTITKTELWNTNNLNYNTGTSGLYKVQVIFKHLTTDKAVVAWKVSFDILCECVCVCVCVIRPISLLRSLDYHGGLNYEQDNF